jgi:hypothetical protein
MLSYQRSSKQTLVKQVIALLVAGVCAVGLIWSATNGTNLAEEQIDTRADYYDPSRNAYGCGKSSDYSMMLTTRDDYDKSSTDARMVLCSERSQKCVELRNKGCDDFELGALDWFDIHPFSEWYWDGTSPFDYPRDRHRGGYSEMYWPQTVIAGKPPIYICNAGNKDPWHGHFNRIFRRTLVNNPSGLLLGRKDSTFVRYRDEDHKTVQITVPDQCRKFVIEDNQYTEDDYAGIPDYPIIADGCGDWTRDDLVIRTGYEKNSGTGNLALCIPEIRRCLPLDGERCNDAKQGRIDAYSMPEGETEIADFSANSFKKYSLCNPSSNAWKGRVEDVGRLRVGREKDAWHVLSKDAGGQIAGQHSEGACIEYAHTTSGFWQETDALAKMPYVIAEVSCQTPAANVWLQTHDKKYAGTSDPIAMCWEATETCVAFPDETDYCDDFYTRRAHDGFVMNFTHAGDNVGQEGSAFWLCNTGNNAWLGRYASMTIPDHEREFAFPNVDWHVLSRQKSDKIGGVKAQGACVKYAYNATEVGYGATDEYRWTLPYTKVVEA